MSRIITPWGIVEYSSPPQTKKELVDSIKRHLVNHNFNLGTGRKLYRIHKKENLLDNFFYLSIQASEHHYSIPKENTTEYTHVEVSRLPFYDDILEDYLDDDHPLLERRVYCYVPIEVLAESILNFKYNRKKK